MSRFSATLSRNDLKFMAQDIGRELMAFMSPEDRLAGLSVEERLAGMSTEDILKALASSVLSSEIDSETRQAMLELLRKMQAPEHKTNGSHHF